MCPFRHRSHLTLLTRSRAPPPESSGALYKADVPLVAVCSGRCRTGWGTPPPHPSPPSRAPLRGAKPIASARTHAHARKYYIYTCVHGIYMMWSSGDRGGAGARGLNALNVAARAPLHSARRTPRAVVLVVPAENPSPPTTTTAAAAAAVMAAT